MREPINAEAYKILESLFWSTWFNREWRANRILVHSMVYVFKHRG